MKITRVLIAAALLLVPTAARSQTVEGVVMDSTRNPIADVRVELRPDEGGARPVVRTDSTGAFRFDSVAGGGAVLRFRHPSYTPVDSLRVEVRRGERVEIELRMGRSPILLEPLVVRARADEGLAGFRDRMRVGGFGRFVSRQQIDRSAALRASDLVRMVPGVQLAQGAPGNQLILMRGGGLGSCVPEIFIDGSRLRQTRDVGIDAFVNPAVLEGVEVYTSAATVPAVFATTNPCGVVAYWTRPAPPGRWSWKRLAVGVGLFAVLFLVVR